MENKLFVALYQEKAPLMKRYLLSVGCQKEDADDLVQETFVKAITYSIHLEEMNLSAWLFKVALHKYYDLCRSRKRHPQVHIDEEQFMSLMLEDAVEIKEILQQDKKNKLVQVLEELHPLYKNLLLMKYELDLSYRQISQVLDMKEDKIKTYLYRARSAFKKSWEEK